MPRHNCIVLVALAAVSVLEVPVHADTLLMTFDENGHSSVTYTPDSGPAVSVSSFASPISGGGIAYDFHFAPFPGLVLITDPHGGISDVFDFYNFPGEADVYSSNSGGIDSLADVPDLAGLVPILESRHTTDGSPPPVSIPETVLPDGTIGAVYSLHLAIGQPGYVDFAFPPLPVRGAADVTYEFISDTPEPRSLLLLGTVILILSLKVRQRFIRARALDGE